MAKKRKSQMLMDLSNNQSIMGATSPVAPVALLIDGENVTAPDLIAHILVEAGKMGGVTVRQVYGNWAAPSMQSWKKIVTHYALEPMGNRSGHNATDIALVIGAMDLLHCGIKHFCLVAGDSDYVPLVRRLRQEGCTVLVIGTASVSTALKEAGSRFLSTDQLVPPALSSRSTSAPPAVLAPIQTTELAILLTNAYHVARQGCETEWVLLSALGAALRQLNPSFQATYGKQSLSTKLKQYPELFETQQREIGNGHAEEVRLRQHLHEKA